MREFEIYEEHTPEEKPLLLKLSKDDNGDVDLCIVDEDGDILERICGLNPEGVLTLYWLDPTRTEERFGIRVDSEADNTIEVER